VIVSLDPDLLERLSRLDTAATTAVAEDLNADLAAAVRRTAIMRRLFYAAVLAVALYGTATGAVARFGLPWPVAIGGIFALELGGVVFLSNAEVRRRLGEHAALSRLLGATVAAAAATFNLLTHASVLFGGFFALMSALGFVAWWLDVENKRRDRLRAQGRLAAATPATTCSATGCATRSSHTGPAGSPRPNRNLAFTGRWRPRSSPCGARSATPPWPKPWAPAFAPPSVHPAAAGDEDTAAWRDAIGEALDSLDEHTDYPWTDAMRQRAGRDPAVLDHRQDS
jgi:hypothetical protein